MSGEELRDHHEKYGWQAPHVLPFQFLQWTLEVGDLAAAEELLRTKNWMTPLERVTSARMVAEAHAGAGQPARGLAVLLETWPSPRASDGANSSVDVAETLSSLGEALWRYGAFAQAREAFREASKASLAAARKNISLPLWAIASAAPLCVARLQLATGDQEGANGTMRGIIELAAVPAYNSTRWVESRAERAWLFARSGFEDEAFAVLSEPGAEQTTVLMSIVRGQAERGDFDSAFQTLERLESEESPKVDVPQRRESRRSAAFWIALNAVRLGEVEPLRKADAIALRIDPDEWPRFFPTKIATELRRLVRTKGVERALKFVGSFEDRERHLLGLISVAEEIASMPSVWDNGLWP